MPIQIAASFGRRSHVDILFPFTSPIRAVSNWTVEGIIAHEKLNCSIPKVRLKLEVFKYSPMIVYMPSTVVQTFVHMAGYFIILQEFFSHILLASELV
jgi:hypothetical protein